MIVTLSLTLPGESASVRVARKMLVDVLGVLDVPEEDRFDIGLVLTETCTNVVDHSHSAGEYRVIVEVTDGRCRITVADSGQGFDPEAVTGRADLGENGPPAADANGEISEDTAVAARAAGDGGFAGDGGLDPAAVSDRGRGIGLVRALTDHLRIHSRPGEGAVIFLEKRFRGKLRLGRNGRDSGRFAGGAGSALVVLSLAGLFTPRPT